MDADETHIEPPPRSYEEMDNDEIIELLVDKDGEIRNTQKAMAHLWKKNYELRVDIAALMRRSSNLAIANGFLIAAVQAVDRYFKALIPEWEGGNKIYGIREREIERLFADAMRNVDAVLRAKGPVHDVIFNEGEFGTQSDAAPKGEAPAT